MSKKCKKAAVGLSFSGALSATIQFLPEDGISDTSIPEYSRPLSKSDRLYVNLFRGARSAIVKIQQAVCQSFPEYSRPLICRITYLCLGNDR